jgi:hypothetical protein
MTRFFLALTVLTIAIGCWVGVSKYSQIKASHDKLKEELDRITLVRRELDETSLNRVTLARNTWTKDVNQLNYVHSEALQSLGMRPSVRNLANLMTRPYPEFAWFSPSKNLKSAVFGMVQVTIMPVAMDRAIFVSDDERLAVIWPQSNIAWVFIDEDEGMREMLCRTTVAPK